MADSNRLSYGLTTFVEPPLLSLRRKLRHKSTKSTPIVPKIDTQAYSFDHNTSNYEDDLTSRFEQRTNHNTQQSRVREQSVRSRSRSSDKPVVRTQDLFAKCNNLTSSKAISEIKHRTSSNHQKDSHVGSAIGNITTRSLPARLETRMQNPVTRVEPFDRWIGQHTSRFEPTELQSNARYEKYPYNIPVDLMQLRAYQLYGFHDDNLHDFHKPGSKIRQHQKNSQIRKSWSVPTVGLMDIKHGQEECAGLDSSSGDDGQFKVRMWKWLRDVERGNLIDEVSSSDTELSQET